MAQTSSQGSLRIFKAFGVDVFVHWSWALLVLIQWQIGNRLFDSLLWHVMGYVGLFGIVLLHEFGHALACRSVGGQASRIVLWPLGGIAFVQPPPRPGPTLWSIAAGPLVNVGLIPVLGGMAYAVGAGTGDWQALTGFPRLVGLMTILNLALLLFNLLPIYPLDGGQIAQSLLWFWIGRARSLKIVAGFSLIVAIAGGLWVALQGMILLAFIAVFVGLQAYQGLRMARVLAEEGAWRV